jgi:hypothetical protein
MSSVSEEEGEEYAVEKEEFQNKRGLIYDFL